MSTQTLIEARRLTRRYGSTLAVSGLDLTLKRGEILGLLGPNGAGKTTTMRMLTGCLAPTEGEVRINGIDLHEDPKGAKRHLGYLPEQPPVYPELTVREYLRFCAALHGVARGEVRAAVDRAAESCGLTAVLDRLIGNLSKGYRQRVGLAQAIIHRPPVIILDEPTVGLDPIQIREIRELIRELGKEHSVILSSHILPEIQAVCSRVMIVHGGRVAWSAPLDAAADAEFESVRAVFGAAPDADAVRALPGVAAVEPIGENALRVRRAPGADPRAALAELAVARGWGLLELVPERRSLEEIFVSLTSGEARPEEVH